MADTPIKYTGNDSDGKPQLFEFSTSEENYLAYQAGLRLSTADSDEVGSLALASAGNATVGSYSDTKFNQAVGTHGTTLTTATTTTTLYQTEGTAPTDGSAYRKPIHHQLNGSSTELHEMTSSEIDSLTDRLIKTIFANDYPGAYKLGSSSPGSGYSVEKSSVFSDTRTDGTTVNYNLYKRTSMTAPTTVRPLHIKRSSGKTGTYQGLQQMTNAQIQYTLGQTAKNRIMNGSNGVGTYLLLSSADGNPTANGYSGTWVAKGSATDTKQETVATAYTRTSTRNFEGNYTRIRQSNFSRNFVGNYTGDFEGNYSRNFGGNFVGDFLVVRTENYSRNFTGTYTGVSNFTRTRSSGYARNFTGNVVDNFEGNYSRGFSRNFTRIRSSNYEGNYSRNYSRYYSRNFAGNFQGNYTGATPTFTRNYTGNYVGTTTYAGPSDQYSATAPTYYWQYNANNSTLTIYWNGTSKYNSVVPFGTSEVVASDGKTYTRTTLVSQSYGVYRYRVSRSSSTSVDYVGNYPGFTGEYVGNYVGPAGSYGPAQYSLPNPQYLFSVEDLGGFLTSRATWNGTVKGSGSASGSAVPHTTPDINNADGYGYNKGSYVTFFPGNKNDPSSYYYYQIKRRLQSVSYTRTSTRVRTSTYSRTAAWTRISTRTSNRQYARTYARAFTRISTRDITDAYSRDYTRDYTRTSTRNRDSNYSRDYSRNFIGNYQGAKDYEGNYARNYSRTFSRNFTRTSTRTRVSSYTRERDENFTRTRTSQYEGAVTDAYTRTSSRDYLGNYVSDEIQNTSETIETYTLYVRTA